MICKNKKPSLFISVLFQLHKDIESLKRAVDPKILPKEYGGVVPLADMIGNLYYYGSPSLLSVRNEYRNLNTEFFQTTTLSGYKNVGVFVPADFKKYLETKRDMVLALDDMQIVVNKKTKFVSDFEDQHITGMAGSFRKLQVD